ncbi:MAG: adenylate/guanylate cyclase domain-containing protein [Solirubrobacterales bacterium]|nr:adenylate/guanylate cyclase domain-containing protein [Solirubrobacterales bacterium]
MVLRRVWPLLVLPPLFLVVLLTAPDADVHWEHHPSHFWLVLGAAILSAVLATAIGEPARRRGDAGLWLLSLAFLAAAGFLGLHALATPRVLLDHPNAGFTYAVPVGLVVAGAFAAASALAPRAAIRHAAATRAALVVLLAAWAALSLGDVPPLDDPTPVERASAPLVVLAVVGSALFAFAAVRAAEVLRRRPSTLGTAVFVSHVLLAEALVATALSRNWHLTWWEWHVLILTAVAIVAAAARAEAPDERFAALYSDEVASAEREISVVFADAAGFTSFSEQHDPAEVKAMLDAYFAVAVPAVVREHGGDVDRLVGDAIVATWNTRGDQPDHARRAAAAALDVLVATERLAAEHPGWPRFRAGANSGTAAVGVLGAGAARSYTVIGDTVNVAARLQGAAPVGAAVIGAPTLRGVPGARVRALGALAVKGKEAPVDAYVLEGLD